MEIRTLYTKVFFRVHSNLINNYDLQFLINKKRIDGSGNWNPLSQLKGNMIFFLMRFPIYLNFKQIVTINFGWLAGPGEDSRASFQNFLEKKRLPRRFFPLIG